MLDMNTIEITRLASEYARGKFIYLILGIAVTLLPIIIFFVINKILYVHDADELDFSTMIYTLLCVFIGNNLLTGNHVKFCQVTIKVTPTEKLTIEQMQKSDKFIEKDGDYYYVKIVKTPALRSEELNYRNFNLRIDQIKSEFNEDVDSIYFKDKIVNK